MVFIIEHLFSFIIWSLQNRFTNPFRYQKIWINLHITSSYLITVVIKKKSNVPQKKERKYIFLQFLSFSYFFTLQIHSFLLSSESQHGGYDFCAMSFAHIEVLNAGLCKRNNWLMTIKRNVVCAHDWPDWDPAERLSISWSPRVLLPPALDRPLTLVIKRVRRSVYRSCTRVDKRCRVSITIRWDIKPRINQMYTYMYKSSGEGDEQRIVFISFYSLVVDRFRFV